MVKKRLLGVFLVVSFMLSYSVAADSCNGVSMPSCDGSYRQVEGCIYNNVKCVIVSPIIDEFCSDPTYYNSHPECCVIDYTDPYEFSMTQLMSTYCGDSFICGGGDAYSADDCEVEGACEDLQGKSFSRLIDNGCGVESIPGCYAEADQDSCVNVGFMGSACQPLVPLDPDYEMLPTQDYIDHIVSMSWVMDVCLDSTTKGQEIPGFMPLTCNSDFTGNGELILIGTNAAYERVYLNDYDGYIILPDSPQTDCPTDTICEQTVTGVACVEDDDINFPLETDFCEMDQFVPTADIDRPEPLEEFPIGYPVWYKVDHIPDAKDYRWVFGDGGSGGGKEGNHAYTKKGSYTLKVTVENTYDCEDTDEVTVKIVPCEGNSDCMGSQECIDGICAYVVEDPLEVNETEPPEPLEVEFDSPINKIYTTTTVELSYTANRETQCGYSLNNGDITPFNGTSTTITAIEGTNQIILECEDVMLSRSFKIDLNYNAGDTETYETEEKITGQEVESIIGQIITEGNITVTKLGEIDGTTTKLTFNVKNDQLVPLKDIILNVNFPKSVISSASQITTTAPHVVIEEDPIIAFDIGELLPGEDISVVVRVERVVTQDDIEIITTTLATTVDEEVLAEMRAAIAATAGASEVHISAEEFQKDGETYTKITTTLVPKQKLTDVDLYQEIPKCLAKHIDELNIPNRERLKIINPDPLIVWHFDEIEEEVDLTFDVKGILDPDCIEQIKGMAIAKELGWFEEEPAANKSLFLPLMIIPVIALIIIFFAKFKPKHKKTDEKKVKHEQIVQKAVHHTTDMDAFFKKHIQDAEDELKRSLK